MTNKKAVMTKKEAGRKGGLARSIKTTRNIEPLWKRPRDEEENFEDEELHFHPSLHGHYEEELDGDSYEEFHMSREEARRLGSQVDTTSLARDDHQDRRAPTRRR